MHILFSKKKRDSSCLIGSKRLHDLAFAVQGASPFEWFQQSFEKTSTIGFSMRSST